MEFTASFFQQRLEHILAIRHDESPGRQRPKHFSFRFSRKDQSQHEVSFPDRVAALSRCIGRLILEYARGTVVTPAPPERVAVAEIDGSVLWAPASDWKRVCYYMLSGGLDPGLARFLRQNLSPGNVFIDIGAGIGAYTLLAASLNGSAAIYSFEPAPEAYRWLASNLAGAPFNINGRVRLQNMALEQSGASLDEIAANARQVALARIGGGSAIPAALRAIERICHNNPAVRIVVEYCSVLSDCVDFPALVEGMERQGFVVRRIDGAGEVRDLQREELHGAFSMNLLLERAGR